RGRSQLLVYHFMFGPDYTAGCATCSTIADGFNGFVVHLANHDVTLAAVSRAPLAKLQLYKQRMGWTFPWASSLGSDFNFDFNVSFTEEQQREGAIEYNYERSGDAMDAISVPEPVADNAVMAGTDAATYTRERPGMSAFVLEDRVVYHVYSTYARGLDGLWGMLPVDGKLHQSPSDHECQRKALREYFEQTSSRGAIVCRDQTVCDPSLDLPPSTGNRRRHFRLRSQPGNRNPVELRGAVCVLPHQIPD
ncbi:MAG: DUF899 family protein, partial [Terrimicrobiaceae bacterium]